MIWNININRKFRSTIIKNNFAESADCCWPHSPALTLQTTYWFSETNYYALLHNSGEVAAAVNLTCTAL